MWRKYSRLKSSQFLEPITSPCHASRFARWQMRQQRFPSIRSWKIAEAALQTYWLLPLIHECYTCSWTNCSTKDEQRSTNNHSMGFSRRSGQIMESSLTKPNAYTAADMKYRSLLIQLCMTWPASHLHFFTCPRLTSSTIQTGFGFWM